MEKGSKSLQDQDNEAMQYDVVTGQRGKTYIVNIQPIGPSIDQKKQAKRTKGAKFTTSEVIPMS